MRALWNVFLVFLCFSIAWAVDPKEGGTFWLIVISLWTFNILGYAEAHFRKH